MHLYMWHIYIFIRFYFMFYFFAAVAQNHFPQLGISPLARWTISLSPSLSLLLLLLCQSCSQCICLCLSSFVAPCAHSALRWVNWNTQPSRLHCVAGSANVATACGTYAVHSFMNAFYMAGYWLLEGGEGQGQGTRGGSDNLTAFTVTRVIISWDLSAAHCLATSCHCSRCTLVNATKIPIASVDDRSANKRRQTEVEEGMPQVTTGRKGVASRHA